MWYKFGEEESHLQQLLFIYLFALHSWSLKEPLWLMVQPVYCMVMQDITKLSVMEWLEATFKLSFLSTHKDGRHCCSFCHRHWPINIVWLACLGSHWIQKQYLLTFADRSWTPSYGSAESPLGGLRSSHPGWPSTEWDCWDEPREKSLHLSTWLCGEKKKHTVRQAYECLGLSLIKKTLLSVSH